ncbi:hypothetical protein HZ993_02760 [Rhodoferax sp. AJA081-3]|uniref:hypothetical protein n=1 Tax=Rhodoferax sp. AJA081-3 TaxID=2752316 RepID=UPI001ADFE7C2|nr:hypothetical protein [Rhodoferax sp. AJA081-3]QTN28787.1 hypothetical protein HZ993_02760 [Rhodoferax sp. AJA081-3]
MKAFWSDCGQGPASDTPVELDLVQAKNTWSDASGVKGNFFGLIDTQGRTIQFYFTEDIPDHFEDARHLEIVLLDIPVQGKRGSYSKQVSIGEVHGLIALAFSVGVDHSSFPGLSFSSW